MSSRHIKRLIPIVVAGTCALGVAACGDDDDDTIIIIDSGIEAPADTGAPLEPVPGDGGMDAAIDAGGENAGRSGGNDGRAGRESEEEEDMDAGMADAAPSDAGKPEAPILVIGVGNWGLRARSSDGSDWQFCRNSFTGDDHTPDLLRNVDYGNGMFVAVGGDDNSMVMRSVDGVHWEEDLHPLDSCTGEAYPESCQNWMGAVAYGDGVWLAGGGNGALMRSEDNGASWTGLHPQPTPAPLRDMAFGGGVFVAGTDSGQVITSTDRGDSWTAYSLWNHALQIAYGNGVFVAWGVFWTGSTLDRGCFIGRNDATTWGPCPDTVWDSDSFAFDGERWIASTSTGYADSTDGLNWTEHAAPEVPNQPLFTGELWLGRSGMAVLRSTDLTSWEVAAPDVLDFRAWVAGRVTRSAPRDVPACEDRR